MESSTQRPLSVLMLPWLAHGHISPYLELAKRLAPRNFHVYLCSTPANLKSVEKKVSVGGKCSDSIRLVELHLPCLPDLPAHLHTTNGLPPHLMPTLKQALDMSVPTFSKILEALKPDLLVYDFIHPWAPALANSYNIPAVEFLIFSAASTSYYHFCHDVIAASVEGDCRPVYPFSEICLTGYESAAFGELIKGDNGNLLESTKRSNEIVLIKSFRRLEGKYLDHIEECVGKRMIPTGPLVEDSSRDDDNDDNIDEFKIWLDEKEPLSAVFVSFGSEYYSSQEELEEIAMGLELSEVIFIWVVRFPIGEQRNIHQVLPKGFLERVEGRGLVVEGWAPQTRILRHPSIGGFVSHCGSSSSMESLKLGVPMIAMPMSLDMPIVAKNLKSVGVAMEVERDGEGRYRREEIARVVKKVVVEEEGRVLRRNARDMSCAMLEKGDEEVDEVAKELVRLCKEANKM